MKMQIYATSARHHQRANFGRDRNQTGNCAGPEWVSASWILLDWSRVLKKFILLSDSHSPPRAKTNLGDHSNVWFAEKNLKQDKIWNSTQKFTATAETSNVRFVRKASKDEMISLGICDDMRTRGSLSAKFVASLSPRSRVYTGIINKSIKQRGTSSVLNVKNHLKLKVISFITCWLTAELETLSVQNAASCSKQKVTFNSISDLIVTKGTSNVRSATRNLNYRPT